MYDEFRKHNYLSLSTYRKNGNSVETPVWFALRDSCLYMFSNKDAGKVKRLRNFRRAKVAPCTFSGKLLGNWLEGEAVLLKDPEDIQCALQALVDKYGWQMRSLNFIARLGGKYQQRSYIRFEASQ